MADVEFDNLRNGRHRLYVGVVQTMTCVHLEPEGRGQTRTRPQPLELVLGLLPARLSISTGVQFDDRRTDANTRFDLRRIRVDE